MYSQRSCALAVFKQAITRRAAPTEVCVTSEKGLTLCVFIKKAKVNTQVQELKTFKINQRSEVRIKLPTTYTRDYIPANRSDIPTCETAKNLPHLEHLADEMSPKLDCEVGLLMGYNCPQALLPRDVLSGKEDQPFAHRSVLGWSIIGYNNYHDDYEDEIGVSHRIIVKQDLPAVETSHKLKPKVHFVCRNKIKEITPADILQVFKSDFAEEIRKKFPCHKKT